jgi:hypothetical protein
MGQSLPCGTNARTLGWGVCRKLRTRSRDGSAGALDVTCMPEALVAAMAQKVLEREGIGHRTSS